MWHWLNGVIHKWDIGQMGSFTYGALIEWHHSPMGH